MSIIVNHLIADAITRQSSAIASKSLLIVGVTANLALIGYFKYSGFFLANLNAAVGSSFDTTPLLLPLGISFYTFQQIAFLVDTWTGAVRRVDLLRYSLFVTFFPQLIAGPIVHHSKVMPQFEDRSKLRLSWDGFAEGLLWFTVGLAKKSLIADSLAAFASPVFRAADAGLPVSTFEAWGAALAYTGQIYYDFSGYSDMAIGLGLLFGIRLPLNFASPYKADSLIEFWRRWHITLSHFLRDYVYIPLGGNRQGVLRRHTNLMLTMLIGGLWHGANWNFVLWGGLHGAGLVLNHLWTKRDANSYSFANPLRFTSIRIAITFLFVVLTWVLFRSTTLTGSSKMISAMLMLDGLSVPGLFKTAVGMLGMSGLVPMLEGFGISFNAPSHVSIYDWAIFGAPLIGGALVIAFACPNSQQIAAYCFEASPKVEHAPEKVRWEGYRYLVAMAAGAVLMVCLVAMLGERPSEFLYFNF